MKRNEFVEYLKRLFNSTNSHTYILSRHQNLKYLVFTVLFGYLVDGCVIPMPKVMYGKQLQILIIEAYLETDWLLLGWEYMDKSKDNY